MKQMVAQLLVLFATQAYRAKIINHRRKRFSETSPSEETNWKNQTLKKAASEENVPQNGVACYYESEVHLLCVHYPVNPSLLPFTYAQEVYTKI